MSAFTKRAVVVDGVRVEVLEAGRGEPIIYFHGAGTTSGFQDLLPLSRFRRLIVPIHPGFGASDDDAGINSMLDYVVHYNALFDQLDLSNPVDLVGHSLGGWMAGLFTVHRGIGNLPPIKKEIDLGEIVLSGSNPSPFLMRSKSGKSSSETHAVETDGAD